MLSGSSQVQLLGSWLGKPQRTMGFQLFLLFTPFFKQHSFMQGKGLHAVLESQLIPARVADHKPFTGRSAHQQTSTPHHGGNEYTVLARFSTSLSQSREKASTIPLIFGILPKSQDQILDPSEQARICVILRALQLGTGSWMWLECTFTKRKKKMNEHCWFMTSAVWHTSFEHQCLVQLQ